MRFSTIALSLFGVITSVTAQSPYPACANPCVTNTNYHGCPPSNLQCLCTNQAFIANTTSCIYAACSGDDLQTSLTTAQAACAKIGFTLTPSSGAPTPTAKSSASSTTLGYSALLGLGAAALAIYI